jgi:hypothetical protein
VNDSKDAQLDDRDTFLGVGQNRIVKWDMRDPSGVVGEMNSPIINPIGGKDYARNTNFNCMATSGGHRPDTEIQQDQPNFWRRAPFSEASSPLSRLHLDP